MCSHDTRMRCNFVDLYYALYGVHRPNHLPIPELAAILKPQRVEPPHEIIDVSFKFFICNNILYTCNKI